MYVVKGGPAFLSRPSVLDMSAGMGAWQAGARGGWVGARWVGGTTLALSGNNVEVAGVVAIVPILVLASVLV